MVIGIDWRSRLIAAAIHFLVTLLIAGIAAALIFFVWFPAPFGSMVGGTRLFLLVVCCDLALGPLLSLVIFNRKKPHTELVIDYLIIGAIQLAALGYGISAVAISRPVFTVFFVDRFEVVTAVELDDPDLEAAIDLQYRSRSWLGPVLVGVQLPSDASERSDLVLSAIGGKDAQLMPKYYRSYQTVIGEVKRKSEALEVLTSRHPERRKELELAVKNLGRKSESLRWVPVHHRFGFWTALVDEKTGYPVDYLPIDPY